MGDTFTTVRSEERAEVKPRNPTTTAMVGPLAGLRALDFSGFIAGSYCPMTLADFGADVIKAESPEGDAFRSFGFGFLGWNRGKRGLSVDTRRPEGQAVVHDRGPPARLLHGGDL